MGVETSKRLVWARTMRPSPCRFHFIRLYRALRMGSDDAPPAADRHAAGYSHSSALKKACFCSAGGRKSPFPPESGRSARRCGILYPQSALSLPASSRPRRAGSRIPPAACGDSVRIRGLRPPAGQASARSHSAGNPPPERSAARVSACALYGSAHLWFYGAGTRALTSCRAPPASA